MCDTVLFQTDLAGLSAATHAATLQGILQLDFHYSIGLLP